MVEFTIRTTVRLKIDYVGGGGSPGLDFPPFKVKVLLGIYCKVYSQFTDSGFSRLDKRHLLLGGIQKKKRRETSVTYLTVVSSSLNL